MGNLKITNCLIVLLFLALLGCGGGDQPCSGPYHTSDFRATSERLTGVHKLELIAKSGISAVSYSAKLTIDLLTKEVDLTIAGSCDLNRALTEGEAEFLTRMMEQVWISELNTNKKVSDARLHNLKINDDRFLIDLGPYDTERTYQVVTDNKKTFLELLRLLAPYDELNCDAGTFNALFDFVEPYVGEFGDNRPYGEC